MNQKIVLLGVTAVNSFIVTAGTALLSAGTTAPSTWALICAGIGGLVAASTTVQKKLEDPPA